MSGVRCAGKNRDESAESWQKSFGSVVPGDSADEEEQLWQNDHDSGVRGEHIHGSAAGTEPNHDE